MFNVESSSESSVAFWDSNGRESRVLLRDWDLVEVDLGPRELLVVGVCTPEGDSLIGVSSEDLVTNDEVDEEIFSTIPCGGNGGGISGRASPPTFREFSLLSSMPSITAFIAARSKPACEGNSEAISSATSLGCCAVGACDVGAAGELTSRGGRSSSAGSSAF